MNPIEKTLYFAYGSNMNLPQMHFRCADATRVGRVKLDGYRLEFCGNGHTGVATVITHPESCVEGVLWEISALDERRLDIYEGYPWLYGKETVEVCRPNGASVRVMAYTLNAPFKENPAPPSKAYFQCLLDGCAQNDISDRPIREAAARAGWYEQTVETERARKPRHSGYDER